MSVSEELIKTTGVGVVLQGRYYLQENQLIIHSNIVDVEKGEVIGFVKRSGPSKESRLYFEIRKAGKSLDPLKWLKTN